jgi:hypothetical protein
MLCCEDGQGDRDEVFLEQHDINFGCGLPSKNRVLSVWGFRGVRPGGELPSGVSGDARMVTGADCVGRRGIAAYRSATAACYFLTTSRRMLFSSITVCYVV